ncbi:DGQHR domain-containing protein, partial [Patescibacteria group bacterium]
MTPEQLHMIANKNLSRYKYIESGIQRDISAKRTKDITTYLSESDATFPNTIIIAIRKNPANSEPTYKINKTLDILEKDGVANILDGQHRLSGFSEDNNKFELPVAIFLDLSLGEQAKIFAKINSTQAKVSLDLVYELFDISEDRSKEKTSYAIVNELNTNTKSPWHDKIKTLSDRSGDMAQGSFAKYIHKELIDKGKILENLYIDDRDEDLKNMISIFFTAVKNTFPMEWKNEDKKFILTKTTGFVGFMAFFKDLIKIARKRKESFSVEYCERYIKQSAQEFKTLTS